MTWNNYPMMAKGKSIQGWVDEVEMMFDVPFSAGIKVGDVFTANSKTYKAVTVTNVANRNENLLIKGELNGKSTERGTVNKTGGTESKS